MQPWTPFKQFYGNSFKYAKMGCWRSDELNLVKFPESFGPIHECVVPR